MAVTESSSPARSGQSTADARETAAEILRTVRSDHRFCANCFRQIREVERPWRSGGKQVKPWMIGFATPTNETIEGVDESPGPESAQIDIGDRTLVLASRWRQKAICECGVTHHRTEHRPLRKHKAIRAGRRLSEAIETLREEYQSGSKADYEKYTAWEHSEHLFIHALKYLKSKPDAQAPDTPFFEIALAMGLKHSHDES